MTDEFKQDELDVIARLESDAGKGLGADDPGADYWDSFAQRVVERRVTVPARRDNRQRLVFALAAIAAGVALIVWLVPPQGSDTALPIEGGVAVFSTSDFSVDDFDWFSDVFAPDLDDELEDMSPQELDAVLVALDELRRS